MTDFAAARRHMVDGQIRTTDVTDLRLISALLEVPRERFMPPASVSLAYLDLDVPVGGGRRLLRPMVLAKLIQAADIKPTDRVLDVGSASGYCAAVLGHIAGNVIALEQDAGLANTASDSLAPQRNVKVVRGPLADGWAQGGPYDVVVVEGATEVAPNALCQQLKSGGRLVCVLGDGPGSKAMFYMRSSGEAAGRAIFDAPAALLPGFAKTPVFAF
ncbi:MAG TPA: protein-L-isoaspartate O-methyltransferase [Pseudolabrys sp.]|nr:protein-L-isoaspartate O-methyltransferase [Pseudolabrys sp.]